MKEVTVDQLLRAARHADYTLDQLVKVREDLKRKIEVAEVHAELCWTRVVRARDEDRASSALVPKISIRGIRA
jgi:hypothetical protein